MCDSCNSTLDVLLINFKAAAVVTENELDTLSSSLAYLYLRWECIHLIQWVMGVGSSAIHACVLVTVEAFSVTLHLLS